MAKCIRCGKSTVVRGHVKLSDGAICTPCFKQLGFKISDATTSSLYSYDQIKDGKDAMYRKSIEQTVLKADLSEARSLGVTMKLVKQMDKAGASDMERKIVGGICSVLEDEGRDIDAIDAALGERGSLLLMIDGTVFIELKADDGVKWIRFDNEGQEKIRIGGAGRMNSLAPRIVAAYDSVPL